MFSGLAYQNLGQADKGEEAFKNAIASNPELPLAQEVKKRLHAAYLSGYLAGERNEKC